VPSPDVLVVDHRDSYTWNLVHLVAEVTGDLPSVVQHDEVVADDLRERTHLVLSPGPGHPGDPCDFAAGDLVRETAIPVLGVCLGMQGIVAAFGGRVGRVRPAHGELASILHDGEGLFEGVPQAFTAVRYHSLAALEVPPPLQVTALSEDGTVMAVRHRELPIVGVQFHPESVLSEHGALLVANFLGSAR